jgi:N6-L-threonylcarbamoyladenine synthase
MIVLGIESSCDETAAAVVADGRRILSSVVASQDDVHAPFGGVVPELASRRHLEIVVPVIDRALGEAGVRAGELDGIAVTHGPGLVGSLLVGCTVAKSMAYVHGTPLVGVNHLEGHIYAAFLTEDPPEHPFLALVVSGGHTALYHTRAPREYALVGQTRDDAAGEAFDKVASMLGLPYPGGPAISQAAEQGDERAYAFPRGLAGERLDFSFSGLKTAVRYAIAGPGRPDFRAVSLTKQQIADLAASFQAAVVDSLVEKSMLALARTGLARLCVGGGVAANRRLREKLTAATAEIGAELVIAPPELCTDNAVMGAIAFERLRAGQVESLDLDAQPGLVRGPREASAKSVE